jgi:hypothetical protein
MPHYKCVPCKTRLHSAGSPPEDVGDLCPDCGSLLEPVGELAEVVGFRAIKSGAGVTEAGPLRADDSIADRIDKFLVRREAVLAQARLDAGLWPDDEDGLAAQAVAMPWPDLNS